MRTDGSVITGPHVAGTEGFGRGMVLVVDDDHGSRKLLRVMLDALEARVTEADGGHRALELLAAPNHDIDLVLLDMMMPECDGIQVLEALAARGLTPALLVLAVTAYDDQDVRRQALEAGAIDFIIKPVDPIELRAKCKTMLELCRLRRVMAEREFQHKERFEAIVANAPSAISVRDRSHRYTLVNEAFCHLFGQTSIEDVIGRTEDEVLTPDVLQRSRRDVDQVLTGQSLIGEEEIDVGSAKMAVMTQRFPLHNSAGEVTELATIRTDITYRKRIEREAQERATWRERISAAIVDDRLLVYSQPIVDIATREAVGEELLVRLGDGATGEIWIPGQFLPQCQRHGLMPLIDRYMVGRAIGLARAGRSVTVNITGQTIEDATVMDEIFKALNDAGPEVAGRILFEITETTALASLATAKEFSSSMSSLGCRVALDDFGTGYGTFTDLRHLNLDTLKIDLSFVNNMLDSADDERAVNTIALVARAYGLTTVAEGVESEATLARLAELGVDRAQGYLFGKPVPVVA